MSTRVKRKTVKRKPTSETKAPNEAYFFVLLMGAEMVTDNAETLEELNDKLAVAMQHKHRATARLFVYRGRQLPVYVSGSAVYPVVEIDDPVEGKKVTTKDASLVKTATDSQGRLFKGSVKQEEREQAKTEDFGDDLFGLGD